jgi:integrase
MYSYSTKQLPSIDEITRKGSTVYMCDNTSVFGNILRKELAMATLKKRRGMWYARIQWRDQFSMKKEKQVPLRTESKVTARIRLSSVNKIETDIKDGIAFSFPWMNEEGQIKVSVFKVKDAVEQWIEHRQKNKIRKKTLEINQLGLKYFMDCNGHTRPLNTIDNSCIATFIDYLDTKGNSDTTINIHLRTIKAMLRHYHKIGKLDSVPVIEQRKIAKTDPIYISDDEFQSLMELAWLDDFYKRVFLLYRETGMRLREPFLATLNGSWIDIPPESKSHSTRSLELSEPLRKVFLELQKWHCEGYGSTLVDPGDNISKVFKKALRETGVKESKHFHSLRHTFAVRMLLKQTPIYEVKLLMGHASVTTTEQYSNMNLKRVSQDFPTLVISYLDLPKNGKKDTLLEDTHYLVDGYVPIYEKIAG